MRKDRFTDEALRNAYALADLKYSENPEDQVAFEEAYDFARCQRPDGSFYGTSGQCRKGKDAGAKAEEPKKTASTRQQAAAEALKRIREKGPETKVEKESYSWGDLIKVSKGNEYKAVLHPKDQEVLRKLKSGESSSFTDEQGVKWKATRDGNSIRLDSKSGSLEMSRGALGAGKEAKAGEPKPKKLKTDFRKDVEKGAAKRKAADEKRAARMTRDNELRGQIRERMAALKPVRGELDRRERAMKEVERRIKKDPSKANKDALKQLQRAVREQDRAVRAAEREIDKMARERLRISKQNERERMTPAQRAEAARVRKIIKERG